MRPGLVARSQNDFPRKNDIEVPIRLRVNTQMPTTKDMLVRIAWQYYIEELTQQEIAERFYLSRSKVARLLKEARETGIIEFKIVGVPTEHLELERRLRSRFKLKDVIVTPTPPDKAEIRRSLGRAAAGYLQSIFRPDLVVGLGMGRTIAEIPQFVNPDPSSKCTFVELVGGASRTDVGFDTYNVSWQLAETCQGVAHHVNSPVVVESPEVRAAIMSDFNITSVLEIGAKSDVAIVGIGQAGPDMTLARLGYCDDEAIHELLDKGAVGDIMGHYYDLDGKAVITGLEGRLIGLAPEEIFQIPSVIGVAGGDKTEAIMGALRGAYIDVLITDDLTASAILERDSRAEGIP